jgi:uncharacterized protein
VERVQVEILGLSTSSASGGAYALILKESSGKRRLPIIIGAFEAQAIALEIEGIKPPRPMTHDLLKSVIDALGFSISEITITELRDGTFFARIALDTPVNDEIDSRPSDAIALAVRYNAPIFVNEDVLNEAGVVPEDEEGVSGSEQDASNAPSKERQLVALQARLQEAIQKEDYELAARLRDDIKRLQPGD